MSPRHVKVYANIADNQPSQTTTGQIRCSGRMHQISIAPGGRVTLHNHTREELTAERILVALGGELCRCSQFLDRKHLALRLQSLATSEYGQICSGYGIGKNSISFYQCTFFSLSWYTLGVKRVRLTIGRSNPAIELGVPLTQPAVQPFVDIYLDIEPKGGLTSSIIADVFPKESVSNREIPIRDALKQLPPLPIDVVKELSSYEAWPGTGGVSLIFNYTTVMIGTPSGWVAVPKNTTAYHTAYKTKDPWRTLAVLGVKIPRIKKKRVWSEAMGAELIKF